MVEDAFHGRRRCQPRQTFTARQHLTPSSYKFKTAKHHRQACLLELEQCQQKQQKLLAELERSEIDAKGPDESAKADEETPDHFMCPISREIMRDPVMLSATCHTYDKSCILRWFAGNNLRCPMTNENITSIKLLPNLVLRSSIRQWCQQHDIVLEPLGDETTRKFHDLVSKLHSPEQREEAFCEIHELIFSDEDAVKAALVEANGIEALLKFLMVARRDGRAVFILDVLKRLCDNEGTAMLLRASDGVLAISRVLEQEDVIAAREHALQLIKALWSNTGKVERNEREVLMPQILKYLQDLVPLQKSSCAATDLLSMCQHEDLPCLSCGAKAYYSQRDVW